MADVDEIRRLLDDFKDAEALSLVPLGDLAEAYCRYTARTMASEAPIEWKDDPDGWAAELYHELVEPSNPESGWSDDDEQRRREFLRLIVDAAPNDGVLSYIGAGPFEDFISADEERLRWVEEHAARSAKFRKALAAVWIASWASEEVFLRIEAAAGAKLSWPDHFGPRPGERPQRYETPEQAAVASFFAHQTQVVVVGSRIDGDEAHVWLLTREIPLYWMHTGEGPPRRWDDVARNLTSDPNPLEEYEAVCALEDGLWRKTDGWVGFSSDMPDDVRDAAAALRRQ